MQFSTSGLLSASQLSSWLQPTQFLLSMEGFTAGVLLSLLVTAASASGAPVTCSSEGVECEVREDNLIDAVMHVMSLEECRQMCLDQESCQFISYYDDSAAPVSHLCQMFGSCDTLTTCAHCATENMACYTYCGASLVGDLDENVQDLLTNIESEHDCKRSCLEAAGCSFYTFYFPNSTHFRDYCFLQTEFVGPAQPCDSCTTAPGDCSITTTTAAPTTTTTTPPGCSLNMDGESSTSLMLTHVNQTSDISGELQTNDREDFWLKVPANAFTFKTLLKTLS